mmetsp:Transcript_126473/g.252701  ORF Transcript_126473/g.252701 Transcript_126473/m.252701 type:complete len:272 (+) Transcript_126473:532-1347(+)
MLPSRQLVHVVRRQMVERHGSCRLPVATKLQLQMRVLRMKMWIVFDLTTHVGNALSNAQVPRPIPSVGVTATWYLWCKFLHETVANSKTCTSNSNAWNPFTMLEALKGSRLISPANVVTIGVVPFGEYLLEERWHINKGVIIGKEIPLCVRKASAQRLHHHECPGSTIGGHQLLGSRMPPIHDDLHVEVPPQVCRRRRIAECGNVPHPAEPRPPLREQASAKVLVTGQHAKGDIVQRQRGHRLCGNSHGRHWSCRWKQGGVLLRLSSPQLA